MEKGVNMACHVRPTSSRSLGGRGAAAAAAVTVVGARELQLRLVELLDLVYLK